MTILWLTAFIPSSRRRPGSSVFDLPAVPFVYLMASGRNGTLYVGVTKDLIKRVYEHKHEVVEGFTKRHGVHDLVWYEQVDSIISAIAREKQLKSWQRAWKIRLIEKTNPYWHDLYPSLLS